MFDFRELFEVVDGKVAINVHVLSIPVLRAVKEAYTDPIPALQYLRYYYDIQGPYADYPEDEIQNRVLKDFPGEYTLEDTAMVNACEWFEEKITPVQRYYKATKKLLEKVGNYAGTAAITDGRDGNLSALQAQIKSAGTTIAEFRKLEKEVEKELEEMKANKNRGSFQPGYDQ